jgi:hypothetical protein
VISRASIVLVLANCVLPKTAFLGHVIRFATIQAQLFFEALFMFLLRKWALRVCWVFVPFSLIQIDLQG